MIEKAEPSKLRTRLEFLEQFLQACELWLSYSSEDPASEDPAAPSSAEAQEALRFINRNLAAAKSVITDTRLPVLNSDPGILDRLGEGGHVTPRMVKSLINQAIGFYDHVHRNTGLVDSNAPPQAFDIEGAIHRALRLSFRRSTPANEKEVQDAIEVILRAIGAPFTREQETAPVGPRAFRPDFALTPLDLALEVKLSNDRHGASAIQEEISADIPAFRTKWKRILFVIYDQGGIDDPDKMVTENMSLFGLYGVSTLLIKH